MRQVDLQKLYNWFRGYAGRFVSANPLVSMNLTLKAAHTERVAACCRAIAESLALPNELILLAEAAGLLHDVGRFPQFTRFGTFSDARSRDHAEMSVEALEEEGVWLVCTPWERNVLSSAILYHNKFALPATCTGDARLLAEILRDADKLDNLGQTVEGGARRYTITLNAAGDGDAFGHSGQGVSPAVRDAILGRRSVLFADVQTDYDRLMLGIGSIYDLNFPHAFATIRDRRDVEQIFALLPEDGIYREMRETVQRFIAERLHERAVGD